MRSAIINETTNIVSNIIVADPAIDLAPAGSFMISIPDGVIVNTGWLYNKSTNTFIDTTPVVPEVVVPEYITPRQARLLLLQQGLLSQVEIMISQRDEATRITWEYAVEFKRNDPLLIQMGADLGLSDEQLDEFFIIASTL